MPLQNRVQPDGEIISDSTRGRFMGNRGILHDDRKVLGKARWRHKAWVTCLLSFQNRHRKVMMPHNYTELFFWDEAVAFAAGHRPCGECRRADYNRFREAAHITTRITDFDTELHACRSVPRQYKQRRHRAEISTLPDGTFLRSEAGLAQLVWSDALLPFHTSGYGAPMLKPATGSVNVLTPEPLVNALREGYQLQVAL